VFVNRVKVVEFNQLVYRLYPDLAVNSIKMEMAYWSSMPAITDPWYQMLKQVQVCRAGGAGRTANP
jgi:hypothetical protein